MNHEYGFAVMDLEQAENRLVAYFAPDARMIHAFETGIDIHSQTASLISRLAFGVHKEIHEISREKGSSTLGNGEQSERDWGKRCNHALNYKMGVNQFSIVYEIEVAQARVLRDAYITAYPGIEDYWAGIDHEVRHTRTLTNPFGRRRRFMDRLGEELFKEAYSWMPQSTVADIINEWGLLPVWRDQRTFGSLALSNQEHDSLWIQFPLKQGWQATAEQLNAILTNVQQPIEWRGRSFVIPMGVKVGLSVGEAKEAEKFEGLVTPESIAVAFDKSIAGREVARV